MTKNQVAIAAAALGAVAGVVGATLGNLQNIFPKPAPFALKSSGTASATIEFTSSYKASARLTGTATAQLQPKGTMDVFLRMDGKEIAKSHGYNPDTSNARRSVSASSGPLQLRRGQHVTFEVEGSNSLGNADTTEVTVEVAPE